MASDTGTFWNKMSTGSASNLLASDGATTTTIDISTTYYKPFDNPSTGSALLEDRIIWAQGGPSVPAITISGLESGTSYNIYLYAGYYDQTFTIDGVSKSLTGDDFNQNQSNWTEGTQYVSFLGITPTSGSIRIYNTALTDTVVSGLQIQAVAVPVPGAVLLGMLGLSVAGTKLRKRG